MDDDSTNPHAACLAGVLLDRLGLANEPAEPLELGAGGEDDEFDVGGEG